MGDATQMTQALDALDDTDDSIPQAKVWARLVSFCPTRPTIDLTGEEFIIGRLTCCDAQLRDSMNISGKHCRIYKQACMTGSGSDIVFLEDLSTNGTFIDGEKIGKGNKMLLSNRVQIALVHNKKNPAESIQYMYQECCEEKVYEEGGPQKIYDLRETLGAGNFAMVKLAINKATGERVAVKVIDKKKCFMQGAKKEAIMREVEILKQLDHPNIVNIRDVFDTDKTLYLVLELVECGELFTDIVKEGHYCEEKARDVFKQLIGSVLYLHTQGIAHRDLKPENILMKSTTPPLIKISDFGLSRSVGDGSFMKTVCGTPQYLAPEILTSGGIEGYGKEVDMWCCGAILYVTLYGSCPFEEGKAVSIFDQIKQGLVEFPEQSWGNISYAAKDLIKRLLTVNPAQRYTAQQAMDHPWTKGEEMFEPIVSATPTPPLSPVFSPLITPQITPEKERSKGNMNTGLSAAMSHASLSPPSNFLTAKKDVEPSLNMVGDKRKRDEEEEDEDSSATDVDEEMASPKARKSNDGIKMQSSSNKLLQQQHSNGNMKQQPTLKKSSSSSSIRTDEMSDDDSGDDNKNNGEKKKKHSNNHNTDNGKAKSESGIARSVMQKSASHNSTFDKSTDASASDGEDEGSQSDGDVAYNSNKSPSTKKPVTLQAKSAVAAPSTPTGGGKKLPLCKYGKSCYRKNPAHFQEFSHPKD